MADNVYMDLRVGHEQSRSRMVHSEVRLGLFIVDAFVYVTPVIPLRMDSLNIQLYYILHSPICDVTDSLLVVVGRSLSTHFVTVVKVIVLFE